jgi:hypothetical protein
MGRTYMVIELPFQLVRSSHRTERGARSAVKRHLRAMPAVRFGYEIRCGSKLICSGSTEAAFSPSRRRRALWVARQAGPR